MCDYLSGVGAFFKCVSWRSEHGRSMRLSAVWLGPALCPWIWFIWTQTFLLFLATRPSALLRTGTWLHNFADLSRAPVPGAGYGLGNVAAQGLVCLSHIYKGLFACAAACCQKYGFSTLLGGQQFWNYAKVIKQRTVKHKRWSEPAGWFNW